MKVLITGGRRAAQSLGTIVRGFGAAPEIESLYIPSRYEGIINGAGRRAKHVRDLLLDAVFDFKPDVLFWWNPKGDYEPGLIAALKAAHPFRAFYHTLDDPYYMDDGSERVWKDFDAAGTCCPGVIPRYDAGGVQAIALYPPIDDLYLRPKRCPDQACDFSFVGTNTYPPAEFPEVLASRVEMVKAAAKLGKVHLYGYLDERPGAWAGSCGDESFRPYYRGFAQYRDIPGILAATAINLNSHVRPDGYKYLNERTIMVGATGAFQLCDRVCGIESIFAPDREIVTWGSMEEFREKAAYYHTHPKQAGAIGIRMRRKVEKLFHVRDFVRKVVEICS